ncbi:MAG TPA: FecR domain-containing protein, partial [Usitatibacteraceae bacterium]|nr:FecR domain-containing protein [Usitatibacteraceae bacterium]
RTTAARMRPARLVGGILIAGMLATAGVAQAREAGAAGMVKTLTGTAQVERGGQVLPLAIGGAVFPGDRIVTPHNSTLGIVLNDDTAFTIGGNSRFSIDQFQFNPTTHQGKLGVALLRGTLRVITGLIARESPADVAVVTPNSVIGVRGTDFIVEVPGND